MELRDNLIYLNAVGLENYDISKIEDFVNENEIEVFEIFKHDYLKKEFSKSISQKLGTPDYDKIDRLKEYCSKNEIDIITYLDENYPDRLRYIENFPRVLYVKGKIVESDFMSIGIVGSRKYSDYGRVAVNYVIDNLRDIDATIVSGMAYGIDSLSHIRALSNGMRTIAVLGCGVDVVYPKVNNKLYDEIIENGAVCSEYPPGSKPLPYRFPLRNRIISGLSLAIVVIEARNKSGSLITARVAAEQGREVFAVPGNINSVYSEGTNSLIRDGAHILSSIEDLLYILPKKSKKKELSVDFSDDEIKIIQEIQNGASEIDELSRKLKLNISELSSILTILELKEVLYINGKNIILNI